jgi:hypothetical protein
MTRRIPAPKPLGDSERYDQFFEANAIRWAVIAHRSPLVLCDLVSAESLFLSLLEVFMDTGSPTSKGCCENAADLSGAPDDTAFSADYVPVGCCRTAPISSLFEHLQPKPYRRRAVRLTRPR